MTGDYAMKTWPHTTANSSDATTWYTLKYPDVYAMERRIEALEGRLKDYEADRKHLYATIDLHSRALGEAVIEYLKRKNRPKPAKRKARSARGNGTP